MRSTIFFITSLSFLTLKMSQFCISIILGLFALFVMIQAQSNNLAMQNANRGLDSARFKPNFGLHGSGSGNNGRNWNAGGNVGAGMKTWESQNKRHQVGVGANYGQSFGRHQGNSWKSKPDIGLGAAYRYNFG